MSSLIVSGKECEHIKSSLHVRTFNDFFSDETFTFGWLETGVVCTVVICIEPDGYGFTYIDWYLTILLVFSDWCGMLLGDDQSLMGFIFPCLHKQVRRTSLPNCEFIDSGSCPISPGNMFTVNLIFRLKHRSQSPMCSGNFFFFSGEDQSFELAWKRVFEAGTILCCLELLLLLVTLCSKRFHIMITVKGFTHDLKHILIMVN